MDQRIYRLTLVDRADSSGWSAGSAGL